MARSRPRVVLVTNAFPVLSETFLVNHVLGLVDSGWDVHVVCRQSGREAWESFGQLRGRPELRGRVHPTGVGGRGGRGLLRGLGNLLRSVLGNPRAWRGLVASGRVRPRLAALRRLWHDAPLIALRPDLVHFAFGTLAREGLRLKAILDCRTVVSFRGFDVSYEALDDPDHYRDVWEQADVLHFVSEDLWRRAIGRGCRADRPHVVIPPAIDAGVFAPGQPRAHAEVVGTPDRPLRVLGVARLTWKKGHEYALAAVRLLVDRGLSCEYRVVGDGEHREAVAFAVRQLGLTEITQLLGAQPPDGVKQAMLWADLFLHGAVSEGFCNAVLEAQAMELPVVCADADGLPENVADQETGFVVPRRNPEALAEKMALLAGDSALRARMGQAGRRRVLAHFQLPDQTRAWEDVYRRLLAPAREGHPAVRLPGERLLPARGG